VTFVVCADMDACAALFARGYTVLPFLSPTYARPSWRPDWDGAPRPWEQLQREVAIQRAHKAAPMTEPSL
jgi:hypothetical protein